MHTYHILLRGEVDISDLNALTPHQMTLLQMEPASTLLGVTTDQAGMVGLLVHLHQLGVGLLAVQLSGEMPEGANNHAG